MTFGNAIARVKIGRRVARKGDLEEVKVKLKDIYKLINSVILIIDKDGNSYRTEEAWDMEVSGLEHGSQWITVIVKP